MVMETFLQWVVDVTDYGLLILGAMVVWEIFNLVAGGSKEDSSLGKLQNKIRMKMPWTDEARELRSTRQEKTRLLSEYIEESKEVKLLEKVQDDLNDLTATLEAAKKNGQFENKDERNNVDKKQVASLSKSFDSAKKEIRQLKRATWRSQVGIKRFEDELQKEYNKKLSSTVAPLESQVLADHDNVIKAIVVAESTMIKIKAVAKAINQGSVTEVELAKPFPTTGKRKGGATKDLPLSNYVSALLKNCSDMRKQVDTALAGQQDAYKNSEGLVAELRKSWG